MKNVNYTDIAIEELEGSFVHTSSQILFFIGCVALGLTLIVTSIAFISTGDIDWSMLVRASIVSLGLFTAAIIPFCLAVLEVSRKLRDSDEEKLL